MYFKVIILLVGISLSAALTPKVSADQGLMQFMVQSRDLSNGNPTRSLGCFDYYIPLLNEITADYERDYKACLDKASDDRSSIDNKTEPQRKQMEGSARDSCQALEVCSSNNNSLAVFDCYADTGAQNSKIMYTISADASEIAAQVRELYRLVKNDQDKCTNASERAYVENTATTYEEMSKCLSGAAPIPTNPPPTTSTEASTTSTTAQPETSSAASESSSAAPETSSAAPQTSSAAPETSSAAPETSSAAPETSSAAPETSSAAPETSSAAPETSSAAPETSSAVPETSSAAPETSSAVTEPSSAAPESSTVIPETSSAVPETSPAVPESSSVAPESSPATPESSSAAPESSSVAPESSSALPESDDSSRSSSSSSSKEDKASETDNRLGDILKKIVGRRQ